MSTHISEVTWPTAAGDSPRPCTITVIFTTQAETLSALREAAAHASGLSAGIRIVVPHIVPYPLPLAKPSVHPGHCRRRLRALSVGEHVPVRIDILLCRDAADGVRTTLAPRSLVVIGGMQRRWWWPTHSQRLARSLRRAGHDVIPIEPNRGDHDFRLRLRSAGSSVLCRLLGIHQGV